MSPEVIYCGALGTRNDVVTGQEQNGLLGETMHPEYPHSPCRDTLFEQKLPVKKVFGYNWR